MDEEIKKMIRKYEYALEILTVELDFIIKEYVYEHKYNPVEHVKTRLKSYESISKKLEKKGYPLTCENIKKYVKDLIGIRIVCSFLSDVYEIVHLIKNFKQLVVIEEKNYIVNPKDTGYTSYHLIVSVPIYVNDSYENIKAEIQIRTIAMDFWASLDHKIQYKFSNHICDAVKKEMFNYAIDIKNLDHRMLELSEMISNYHEN